MSSEPAVVTAARAWVELAAPDMPSDVIEQELRDRLLRGENGFDVNDVVLELLDYAADLREQHAGGNGAAPSAPATTTQPGRREPRPPVAAQPEPAQNAEAEESVLGALLVAGSSGASDADLVARALAMLEPEHFYRPSNGLILAAIRSLHGIGAPIDAISVAAELERRGQLKDPLGKPRLHELAALVPATANILHHARLVVAAALRREQLAALAVAQDAIVAGNLAERPEVAERVVAALTSGSDAPAALPFVGRTHGELLALELPAERYLIEDLIPVGAVGTIAAVPEAHKSWLAQAIAVRVAAGSGEILGRPVARAGRVAYVWQDDSELAEQERVQTFEHAHPAPADLSLWWFLNQAITLPADLGGLRATVDELTLDLLILDSFYNFLAGADLKAEDAERAIARLKHEIADPTGCTVLIVDHMPWATDTNRGRLRAYGGVFKGAATRFGIYIEAEGKRLSIEARGNNIRGFKKTPAYWDNDTLELRLLSTPAHDDITAEEADALAWITTYVAAEHAKTHTGIARGKVETAYHEAHGNHGRNLARRVIDRQLDAAQRGETTGETLPHLARGPGETPHGIYLYPFAHAPSPLAVAHNGETGETHANPRPEPPLAASPPPYKGREASGETGGEGDQPIDQAEIERLAHEAREAGL